MSIEQHVQSHVLIMYAERLRLRNAKMDIIKKKGEDDRKILSSSLVTFSNDLYLFKLFFIDEVYFLLLICW